MSGIEKVDGLRASFNFGKNHEGKHALFLYDVDTVEQCSGCARGQAFGRNGRLDKRAVAAPAQPGQGGQHGHDRTARHCAIEVFSGEH